MQNGKSPKHLNLCINSSTWLCFSSKQQVRRRAEGKGTSDNVSVSSFAEEVRKEIVQEAREERIERKRRGLALKGITTEDDENVTDQHGASLQVTDTTADRRVFPYTLNAQAKNRDSW